MITNNRALTQDIREWKEALAASPDAFGPKATSWLAHMLGTPAIDETFSKWWHARWTTLPSSLRASAEHVPLEALRWWQSEFARAPWSRTFRSSGSTQSERSLSPFSASGLRAYALQSLYAFYHVLKRFYPDPFAVPGWSLVPGTKSWPDSSLAQMVEWISELWTVNYGPVPSAGFGAQPLWLFGTAFDYVNACDDGEARPLPAGSILFETGGTKGKSRSVTREELYALLQKSFAVSDTRIVSEYGMCELAAQAYDIATDGSERNSDRYFQFPSWVNTAVQTSAGQLLSSGEGALTLTDPWRLDIPLPIRTQDQAHLRSDGHFRLLGRVPFAVLKGCSLRVEQVREPAPAPSHELAIISPEKSVAVSYAELSRTYLTWLLDPTVASLLSSRLGSPVFARRTLDGLRAAWPTAEAFPNAVKASGASAQHWLFIGPQTHPIAILEPALLQLAAGGRVTIRVPSGQEHNVERHFVDFFSKVFPHRLEAAPSSLRIGAQELPKDYDSVLAFCDDTTATLIRKASRRPVSIYGEALAFAIYPTWDALQKSWPEAMAASLSLGQLGCLSLRGLWVAEPMPSLPTASLTNLSLAQWHEAWRYHFVAPMSQLTQWHDESGPVLIPHVPETKAPEEWPELLSRCASTVPIFFSKDDPTEKVRTIFPAWQFGLTDNAGFPTWNGTHQGRGYFMTESVLP